MRRRIAVHWPSVRGRARADLGSLVLAAAVVAALALLAGAVPPQLRATADTAVQDAVRRAGDDAGVQVTAPWEYDDGPTGGRLRDPLIATEAADLRSKATDELSPDLRHVMDPSVVTVTSNILKVTDGSVLRTFQLAYLAGPAVTWVAGTAAGPAVARADGDLEVHDDRQPWPVQVGLSEADAAALGVRPGAQIPLEDDQRQVKNVVVSGVFRATDPDDPAWRRVPGLLRPTPGADGVGTTRLAGLLSPDSLPDARLAVKQDQLQRTVWFTPDPGALRWNTVESIAAAVVALKAASGSSGSLDDTSLMWQTQLDSVLHDVRVQVAAASAQASVLITCVLAGGILVLLLAADLLVRRRAPTLATARQRGAALPDLAVELLIESTTMAVLAAAVGLASARVLTPGVAWRSALPVVLAAAVAGPVFGILAAAAATRDRRVPANRAARHRTRDTARLRRAGLEIAALLAAVTAFVILDQRGIISADPGLGQSASTALPAAAPALGALVGALVLLRLLPAATGLALRQALRSRAPLAVFGAARAAATAGRALPLLVLVSCAALASCALTLHATAEQGLADGAWRSVGADVRLDVAAGGSVPDAARRMAASPGVREAVVAQVTDRARVVADSTVVSPRLVIVDAVGFQRLLATTPLPDVPQLSLLAGAGHGDVPALVRSADGSLRPGMRLRVLRADAPAVSLVAVGVAPAVDDAPDVVLVDAAAAAAAGMPAVPNTVWVTGPGAVRAATTSSLAASVVVRQDLQAVRRKAPLTTGLLRLAWTAAVTLLALGLLGVALGAAAGAPERWQTLTRLRTLGLRPRDARGVAAWELLPPVVLAAVAGALVGVLLARLVLGPLALRRLTVQSADPLLVPPWPVLGLLAVILIAAAVVAVPFEWSLRRRRRLGEVLRA